VRHGGSPGTTQYELLPQSLPRQPTEVGVGSGVFVAEETGVAEGVGFGVTIVGGVAVGFGAVWRSPPAQPITTNITATMASCILAIATKPGPVQLIHSVRIVFRPGQSLAFAN
jgi:hypothetical protein